jgi:hypothetical protein
MRNREADRSHERDCVGEISNKSFSYGMILGITKKSVAVQMRRLSHLAAIAAL